MKTSAVLTQIELPDFYKPGWYYRIQWNDVNSASVWTGNYKSKGGAIVAAKRSVDLGRVLVIELTYKDRTDV